MNGERLYTQAELDEATGWARFAGLLDGEGYIGAVLSDLKSARPSFSPRVAVQSTTHQMQKFCEDISGSEARTKISYMRTQDGHSDKSQWRVSHPNTILYALNGARKYLLIKDEQADLVIELAQSIKDVGRLGRARLPDYVYYRRKEIYERLKELNAKGNRT